MSRLTEYHNGVAVIKDKSLMKEAMEKLAQYEDMEDALEKKEKQIEKQKEEQKEERDIRELGLSVRAYNILKRNRVNTIEQLLNKTENCLMRMRGMGLRTYEEIKTKLEENER